MKISVLIVVILVLATFSNANAQKWISFTDSIYSNIAKGDDYKAKDFLKLAEEEIANKEVKQDSLYADFIFCKGLLKYFTQKESLDYFEKALIIWSRSKPKNYIKILKANYYLGLVNDEKNKLDISE